MKHTISFRALLLISLVQAGAFGKAPYSCQKTAEQPFSDMVVFAGPLEDTGNFASVFGDLPAPFFENRFSDGPLAVEFLAAQLGLELKPSLHRVGPVQGNNFSSVDALAAGDEPQDLAGQLDAYLASNGGVADPDALYYIIIGGNEVIEATFEPDDKTAKEIVAGAIDAKEVAIRRLVQAGAKTILMGNFIDVAITPQIRLAGLSERGTKMSAFHNRLLEKMLDRVERKLDFELIRHDFYRFANDTLRNAAIFGFTNTTDSCLDLLATGQCDLERFIFFNDLFPTASVHEIWGHDLIATVLHSLGRCEDHPSRRSKGCRHHRDDNGN